MVFREQWNVGLAILLFNKNKFHNVTVHCQHQTNRKMQPKNANSKNESVFINIQIKSTNSFFIYQNQNTLIYRFNMHFSRSSTRSHVCSSKKACESTCLVFWCQEWIKISIHAINYFKTCTFDYKPTMNVITEKKPNNKKNTSDDQNESTVHAYGGQWLDTGKITECSVHMGLPDNVK